MENPNLSVLQKVLKFLLGTSLVFTGLAHLSFSRAEFLAQVPHWIPFNADAVVILSGVVEIGLGALLVLSWRNPRRLGFIVGIFFIAIFPGNISQYVNGISAFGLDTDQARLIRLFFQPILVLWALWSCGSLAKK